MMILMRWLRTVGEQPVEGAFVRPIRRPAGAAALMDLHLRHLLPSD
jgi:hypothetical protein